MPAPLATPVIAPRPERNGTLASFGVESVVRMASLNRRRCSAEAPAVEIRNWSCSTTGSTGSNTPIIPVEEGNTSLGRSFSSRAASAQMLLQFRIPAPPVAQFALPEFTMTAPTRPLLFAIAVRPTSTGAATTRFLVNRADAAAVGSARIKPTSGFPLDLMPAVAAENLNPLGRKIGPDSIMRATSQGSWPVREGLQTGEAHP